MPQAQAKTITLLGSTGSIGTQSLDVARAQGYRVFGLAANRQVELLARQIAEFHPGTPPWRTRTHTTSWRPCWPASPTPQTAERSRRPARPGRHGRP